MKNSTFTIRNIIAIALLLFTSHLFAQKQMSVDGGAEVDTLFVTRSNASNKVGKIFSFSNSNGGFLQMEGQNKIVFKSGVENPTTASIHFGVPADSEAMTIQSSTGNVGLSTVVPKEKLEVQGAVMIGNTFTDNPGTIKYTGTDFEGYDGVEWKSLTTSGTLNLLIDDDGDSKIEFVESSSDNIRFSLENNEFMTFMRNSFGDPMIIPTKSQWKRKYVCRISMW